MQESGGPTRGKLNFVRDKWRIWRLQSEVSPRRVSVRVKQHRCESNYTDGDFRRRSQWAQAMWEARCTGMDQTMVGLM